MKKKVGVSCPMDCFDLCRFMVTVENNRVVRLQGDKDHPLTKGLICKKGRSLVQRLYHPERILSPLIRQNNKFVKASYQEVFDIIAETLASIKTSHGPAAVLNYNGDGYGGLKGKIQTLFFNCFGGASRQQGSLCWGAGMAAQKYDFGNAKGHFPVDVLNSGLILIWGRNPKETGIHLFSYLKQAEKRGSRVIVIDPVKSSTAGAFDDYIRINPATDGALALAMANVIIEAGLCDKAFIDSHVLGFDTFRSEASLFSLEKAEVITGVPAGTIESLALSYAGEKAATIYIGYGLQRYHNGGNTVRCIDALGAITGKIGKKGCGVNYAAKSISPYLNDVELKSRDHITTERRFSAGKLGDFLDEAKAPSIRAVFVSSANPLNQGPDLKKTVDAFSKIEFKVVFDHFMTDTARFADIVIPAAFVFEQDDIFTTSMYSPFLNYSQKAVDPPGGLMPEFDFFLSLASRMGIETLGFKDSDDYLKKSVAPLLDKFNIAYSDLKDSYFCIEKDRVAWEDLIFETPSNKIELYSKKALTEGVSPFPMFIKTLKSKDDLPLRLLTCHTGDSMHSQGFAFCEDLPVVYLNRNTAQTYGIQDQSHVCVKGKKHDLKARVSVTDDICDGTAFIHQGWRHKSGAVNFLTNSIISDMGEQVAYYDSFCAIEASD